MSYFKIGQIVNTHGITGEIKIYPYTDDIDNLLEQRNFFLDEELTIRLKVKTSKLHKTMIIVKFEGVNTIEEAEKLKNKYIYIKRDSSLELDQNTYYIEDLIGLDVVNFENNEIIGKISYVWNTVANDVYEVVLNDGKKIYLPAIHEVIKNVDIKSNKMIVKIMEGLV